MQTYRYLMEATSLLFMPILNTKKFKPVKFIYSLIKNVNTCNGAERRGCFLNNPFLSRLLIITGIKTIPGAAIPIL